MKECHSRHNDFRPIESENSSLKKILTGLSYAITKKVFSDYNYLANIFVD
jgi:hypothetical protein